MHSHNESLRPTARVSVLVVEDTAIVAEEIVRMVKSFGLDVVGPIGALEPGLRFVAALDEPDASHIDIALLDVNLGGRRVFPLAEALLNRGVPVVFLTGYARESIPAEFRSLACLEKPFGLGELERTIEQALGHAITR